MKPPKMIYMVEFEDGLRPHFVVYAVDFQARKIYMTEMDICINETTADDEEVDVYTTDFEVKTGENANMAKALNDLYRNARTQGANCIRVQSQDDMKPAAMAHIAGYMSDE